MAGLLITFVFALVGAAVERVVGRSSAFLLGVGVCGMALYVGALLGVPMVVLLVALLFPGFLGSWVLARRSYPGTRELRNPATLLVIALLIALAFTTIVPLNDFDGRAFWLLKAKAIEHERDIDGPFFRGETIYDPRNEYPLLMPLNAAAIFALTEPDDAQVRWLYLGIFAALLLRIARAVGTGWAVAVAFLPQFAVGGEGGALSAYNDIAIGAFAACALFDLMENAPPVRFGLWLAFLALTKNEGLPYALILFAAGAWVYRKRVWQAAVPLAVAVSTLLIWRSRIPRGDEENLTALLMTLPSNLDRLPAALITFIRQLFVFRYWGVFWIAVLLAIAILVRRVASRRSRVGISPSDSRLATRDNPVIPLAVLAAMFALYTAVYSVTTWTMHDLINASANRLLMHLIGPAVWLLARAYEVDEPALDVDADQLHPHAVADV